MVTYKILNQRNPHYDELLIKKMELLYQGAPEILQKAALFMPQELQESSAAYQARLNCASYYNHFAQIVNDYTSTLFSKSLSIVPSADASDDTTLGDDLGEEEDYYKQFATDCDLQDNPLSEVLRKILIESLTTSRAYIGVDFPKLETIPSSLLEEEEMGANRAYLYEIPVCSMIDWEYDDFYKYKYVVLRSDIVKREKLTDTRDKKTIQFKVWEKDGGVVKYSVYQVVCKVNQEPKLSDEIPLVEEGVVSFKDIPILCLDMPDNLYIGGLIGALCSDHYKRYTGLIHCENRSLFAFPVFYQGPEIPAVGGALTAAQENPNRGNTLNSQWRNKGFVVAGVDDKIEFVEPAGSAYQLANDQLKELVESIHQIVNQMSNSILQTQSVKSGTSKMMDGQAKEINLSAYGKLVKKFAIELYRLISEARNEAIVWQALGMDSYKITDREILLQEISINNQINKAVPSKTLLKVNAQRLAFQLNEGLEPAVQLTIKQEIDEYFDAKDLEQLTNPDGYQQNQQQQTQGMVPPVQSTKPMKDQVQKVSTPQPSPIPGQTGGSDSLSAQANPGEMHLRGVSSAGIAETVYQQLAQDYDPELLAWVRAASWSGPSEVPLEVIDDSNRQNWAAVGRTGKIQEMGDKMSEGWNKPIILVNEPNDNRLRLIDGHTRYLAAESIGKETINAFIASVGMVGGDWSDMHDLQGEGEAGGNRQTSGQLLSSNQK